MKITIIIPAYNAAATLRRCLNAVLGQADAETEVLLIDDCSTDDSAKIAQESGVKVLKTSQRGGPGSARNTGAQNASGEILFFIDSDVVIAANSVELVRNTFLQHPEIAAVFGSYDDAPEETNFLSQYKNLLHHFIHHESKSNTGTFWAGCGAVRANIFQSMNGFDADRYRRPSIEDIELGIRMTEKEHRILLNPQLQGKHLKRWTIRSLLKADILDRAYPWSQLIARRGVLPTELNLKIYQRLSGALTLLLFLLILTNFFIHSIWIAGFTLIVLASLIVFNYHVYLFFLRKKGFLFMIGAIFWHLFYYFYSTVTFLYCWLRFRIFAGKPAVPSSHTHSVRAGHGS